MPGLAGYLNLIPNAKLPQDLDALLVQPLLHESNYSTRDVQSLPGSRVVLIDPGVDARLCGTAYDPDAKVSAAFYGEFYGAAFQDTTLDPNQGDDVARVLLQLYQKHGEDLPAALDGSFIVFIADLRNNKILIAADHTAARPLFYFCQDGVFAFAPELKSLPRLPGAGRTINPDAFVSFLANGHLRYAQTFYKNIHPLLPGYQLTLKDGALKSTNYFPYDPNGTLEDRGEAHYIATLGPLLLGAVEKRLRSIEHTLFPLSGGMDSRGILGCAARISHRKLRTVTWGSDDTTPGADGEVARGIAKFLGTDHRFIRRQSESFSKEVDDMLYRVDGLTDDAAFHHNELPLIKRLRAELGATDLMRGEECFGHWVEPHNDVEALALSDVHEMHEYATLQRVLNPALRPELSRRSLELHRDYLANLPQKDFTDRRDNFYFIQRLFHYHSRCAYFKYTVLDVKSPWLDKDIFKFYQTVPVHYRWERDLYAKTLHRLLPELMALPLASKNSLENWLQIIPRDKELQRFIQHHLLESKNGFHEFLDLDAVRDVVQAAFRGVSRPSMKQRSVSGLKDLMRKTTPGLYRRLKPKLMGKMRGSDIPADILIFRMLVAKMWFDRFES